MKTAVKKIKPVKRSIKNFDEKNLPEDLIEAIEGIRLNRNLHDPFDSAEDAIKSMLRD